MNELTLIVVKLDGKYSQREIDLILSNVNSVKAVIDFGHDDRHIDIGFGDANKEALNIWQ